MSPVVWGFSVNTAVAITNWTASLEWRARQSGDLDAAEYWHRYNRAWHLVSVML